MKGFSFLLVGTSLAAVSLGGSSLTGCASGAGEDGGAGGSIAATATTDAVTSTAMSSTAAGGCPQDCSTVAVPACYESVCNLSTLTCDVKQSANGSDCDDGVFCTVDEKCHNGTCDGGTAKTCETTNPCATATCDTVTDACKEVPAAEQSHCASPNPCAVYGLCIGGDCLDVPKDCAGLTTECSTGQCDMTTGDCVAMPTNDGDPCTGGSFCETDKVCTSGACMGDASGLTEVMMSGSGLPLTIPDGNLTGITNNVAIAGTGNIVALAIEMDITHGYDGDVVASLVPPSGSPVILTQHLGSSDDNFTNTVFSSTATTPIASGTAPFTGEFSPVGSFTPLIGTSVTGTWGLKAVDDGGGVTGTLDAWTFRACVQ